MESVLGEVERLYAQGVAWLQEREYDVAEKCFNDGLDVLHPIPTSLRLQLLLGRSQCRMSNRNYGGARRDCTEAVLFDATNTSALLRRAMACEYIGDYASGVADAQRCLFHLTPDDVQYATTTKVLQRLESLAAQDAQARQTEERPEPFITLQQALRLAFVQSLPRVVCPDKEYCVSVSIGNEFGLWDRQRFSTNELVLQCNVIVLDSTLQGRIQVRICRCSHYNDANDPVLGSGGKVMFTLCFVAELSMAAVVLLQVKCASRSVSAMPVFSTPIVLLPQHIIATAVLTLPTSDSFFEYLVHNPEVCCAQHMKVLHVSSSIDAQCIRSVACGTCADSPREVYAFECPGYLGIGGKVWDATFRLIDYFSQHSEIIHNKRVLELGSGTGLAAIALHHLKPSSVMLTDMADVVPLLQANIELNGVMIDENIGDIYSACTIEWGQTLQHLDAEWSDVPDVIVASDVVYDPEGYIPLITTLETLISRRTACGKYPVFYMAHRHRNPEDFRFFESLSHSSILAVDRAIGVENINNGVTETHSLRDIEMFVVRMREE